jgi:hypothetical protein
MLFGAGDSDAVQPLQSPWDSTRVSCVPLAFGSTCSAFRAGSVLDAVGSRITCFGRSVGAANKSPVRHDRRTLGHPRRGCILCVILVTPVMARL